MVFDEHEMVFDESGFSCKWLFGCNWLMELDWSSE